MTTSVPVKREPIDQVIRQIKIAMLDKDWNQADLARHLGVTEDWVSRRFKRRTDLSVIELFRIAGALDVSARSLVPGIDTTGWEPRPVTTELGRHPVRALPERRSLLPGIRPTRFMPSLENAA